MSTAQVYHFQFRNSRGELGMAPLPIWKEFLNYLFALLIFLMTLGTIATVDGPVPVASVVIVGILSVLYIFGGRVEYISYGDLHVELSQHHSKRRHAPDKTDSQQRQSPPTQQSED
jgi:hypothetical protein